MDNPKISKFKGTSAINPQDITLEDALDMVQFDEDLMTRVMEYRQTGDNNIKTSLPSVTFGAHFDTYRATKMTDKFTEAGYSEADISYQGTGRAIIEYDHLDTIEAAQYLRDHLFDRYMWLETAFISPGGKGVKTLVKIPPVQNPHEYDQYFDALMDEFKQYNPDTGNYGIGRLLFLSHDTGLRQRSYSEAIEYTLPEGFSDNGSHRDRTKPKTEPVTTRTKQEKYIRDWLIKALDNVPDDNRHPHMMKKLKRAGGLVPKYCTQEWLTNLCDVIIETDSKYDQIDTRKQNIRDAITAGMKETIELDDLTAIDMDEMRLKTRLDMTEEIMEPPVCLKIAGSIAGSLGNVITFMGPAKSRKGFFLTAAVAAAIKGGEVLDGKIEGIHLDERTVLRYFDTEQSKYHLQKAAHRIMRKAQLELTDPRIEFYGLAAIPTHERLAFIDHMIMNNDDAWCAAIDGIRDLMKDINSSEDSTDILDYIQRWKFDKNMLIIGLLHQNKTDRNLRGHIGTEIMNKSESVIRIEKYKKDKTISIVSPEEMRNKEFEPFAFNIDPNEDVQMTEMPEDSKAESKGPENFDQEDHYACVQFAFEHVNIHNKTSLKGLIRTWFKTNKEFSFGDEVARRYVDHFEATGMIKETKSGSKKGTKYMLNKPNNDLFATN